MKFVVFGLAISSSWGNGHATLWRGLARALAERSHELVFFERDAPYYRASRDLWSLERGALVIYDAWEHVEARARAELREADAAIVTSFCPDGRAASELVLDHARGLRVFYDLDTPVTLADVEAGAPPPYLPGGGLGAFDCVLSFTGGDALRQLEGRLGARRVAPLYGHVDPEVHRPAGVDMRFRAELSYLGTYSRDRERAVDALFMQPARARSGSRFVLAGSQYPNPEEFPLNVVYHQHVPPECHPSLYCSSRVTLNVTRATMAALGHCPSGRLFEATACGAAVATDWFEGLDAFFDVESELFVVNGRDDVLDVLQASDAELARRARAARERTLAEHSAARRVIELERLLWPSRSEQQSAARAATGT